MLSTTLRKWTSLIASVVFIVLFVLVQPLCPCPRYYIGLGGLALIPLYCGPKAYRLFGVLALLAAVVMAAWQQNSRQGTRQQFEELRARVNKR